MMQEMDMTPQHRIQSPRHESTPDWGSLSGFQSHREVVPQKIRHRGGSRERHSRNSRHSRHARSPARVPRQSNESRRRSSREFRPDGNWQN